MAMSPARRHLLRMAGASATDAQPGSESRAQRRTRDVIRVQLETDLRRLSTTQSISRRIALKREMLPAYAPYVQAVLQADTGEPNDMLTTLMVWCLDVGDFTQALTIGRYVIRHGLALPERYKRSAPAMLAEGMADAADVPRAMLVETYELTSRFDMVDEIAAKLHKAIGLAFEAEDPDLALTHLQRAHTLNRNVGVKRDMARIHAAQRASSPEPAPEVPRDRAARAGVQPSKARASRSSTARQGKRS
ncbi:phage terminase small subunit [Burkholderia gladioli]|uniref:phage terminase small subunit n=1 Tax=Burkholderia gladioli TaxID=28095 RepID=UPI001641CDE2|nr:phage terminase small subunit [Burkholderia gladioli]